MKQDTAIEILKIAAELAALSIAHKAATESSVANKATKVEATFSDCVAAVHAQFEHLVGAAK